MKLNKASGTGLNMHIKYVIKIYHVAGIEPVLRAPSQSDDRPVFTCKLCDKKFTQPGHLKRHHITAHSGIKPYK